MKIRSSKFLVIGQGLLNNETSTNNVFGTALVFYGNDLLLPKRCIVISISILASSLNVS